MSRNSQFDMRAQMPEINANMEPVYQREAPEGERLQLLRRRQSAEKSKIKRPLSDSGVRCDVMIALVVVMSVFLMTSFLTSRGGYWSTMNRVSRAEQSIRETERRITELRQEITEKSAGLNVPYEAVKIGMVASSSMPVISLYAPTDAITLPNGEIDPSLGVRSASN
ncbi:MAG: hypothetical protein IKP40_01090 [Clostridia bacterium]|nr:hypothetical protein [Clostridia bacterium]